MSNFNAANPNKSLGPFEFVRWYEGTGYALWYQRYGSGYRIAYVRGWRPGIDWANLRLIASGILERRKRQVQRIVRRRGVR